MRRSPVVVVLLALVLAMLGAATTAFALFDKTVKVDVDGRERSVRTFAGDVAGALRKAGIELGPHDTVAPGLDAPLHDGSRVIVRHGRLLSLTVDGHPREVWVTALSVDEALGDLGLADRGAFVSASRSLAIPRTGLSLELRRPQHVVTLVDGRRIVRETTAPTVAALLTAEHVRLRDTDRVSVPLQRYPTSGLVVRVDRIRQHVVTRTVSIPFKTRHVRTSALYVGQTKVRRYGVPGARVLTFRLTFKNSKLVKRTLVHKRLRSHPRAQIVLVGTKARPQYSPSADGLNWAALANCESGGNPRSVSGNGLYRGLYQFTISTWHNLGGSGDPIDASSSEQTYRAQILYRRSGDAAWPSCGRYLYT